MIDDTIHSSVSRYAPYKSLPEYKIASVLDKYGLPFIYEKPTAIMDRGQVRLWYPDFSLSYGPVIEYFGMRGDRDYDRRTQHKLNVYQQNHIQVVPMYPNDMESGWQDRLMHRVDRALESRLQSYRTATRGFYKAPHWRGPSGYRK